MRLSALNSEPKPLLEGLCVRDARPGSDSPMPEAADCIMKSDLSFLVIRAGPGPDHGGGRRHAGPIRRRARHCENDIAHWGDGARSTEDPSRSALLAHFDSAALPRVRGHSNQSLIISSAGRPFGFIPYGYSNCW